MPLLLAVISIQLISIILYLQEIRDILSKRPAPESKPSDSKITVKYAIPVENPSDISIS